LGKSTVILLRPNMTFEEKRLTVIENQVQLDKDIKPSFTPGRSVFHETGVSKFKFWKNRRKLIILAEGALQAFEYIENPGLVPHWWTLADAKKFVAQMIAKTKGQMKPFSNWQVFAICGLLIFIIVLQLLGMRVIRF
jgi:hypothetical protein